jgi:hypothetical protein
MYEAHFTARSETYTAHDHRAADANTAVLVVSAGRYLARALRRRRPDPARATANITPTTDEVTDRRCATKWTPTHSGPTS